MRMLKHLTAEEKSSEPVEHALSVRKALAQGNYGRFFKLFRTAPNSGQHLMDIFMSKHRILCLQKLAMAYVQTNIEVAYLAHLLAFDSNQALEAFLKGLGCQILLGDDGKKRLHCKESMPALRKAPLKVKESAKARALRAFSCGVSNNNVLAD